MREKAKGSTRWSQEEIEIIKKNAKVKNIREIAELINKKVHEGRPVRNRDSLSSFICRMHNKQGKRDF